MGRLHPQLIQSSLGKLGPILGLGQVTGLLLQGGLGVRFFFLHLLQLELDPVELLSLLLKGNMMRVVALLQARLERGRGNTGLMCALQYLQLLCIEGYNQ